MGVVAQWIRCLTLARKVMGSIPSHGMEELGRSSCKPLPHPTQVQWVLGNSDANRTALDRSGPCLSPGSPKNRTACKKPVLLDWIAVQTGPPLFRLIHLKYRCLAHVNMGVHTGQATGPLQRLDQLVTMATYRAERLA